MIESSKFKKVLIKGNSKRLNINVLFIAIFSQQIMKKVIFNFQLISWYIKYM